MIISRKIAHFWEIEQGRIVAVWSLKQREVQVLGDVFAAVVITVLVA